jgi:hypothetical protein
MSGIKKSCQSAKWRSFQYNNFPAGSTPIVFHGRLVSPNASGNLFAAEKNAILFFYGPRFLQTGGSGDQR